MRTVLSDVALSDRYKSLAEFVFRLLASQDFCSAKSLGDLKAAPHLARLRRVPCVEGKKYVPQQIVWLMIGSIDRGLKQSILFLFAK